MTWWQTLIVAAVPALVTSIALMVQLRITNRAEDRRRQDEVAEREKDREAADALRKEERSNEMDDHWRDTLHDGHRELLIKMKQISNYLADMTALIDALRAAGPDMNDSVANLLDVIKPHHKRLIELQEEAAHASMTVQLLGSKKAQAEAMKYDHTVMYMMLALYGILNGNGHREVNGTSFYDDWKSRSIDCTAASITYSLVVRDDLKID